MPGTNDRSEAGQALIFFAVLAPLLLLTMGLAIEGGNVFTAYRHLQNTADIAALVGAQRLPCMQSNATCISQAESDACSYAQLNGVPGCMPGDTTAPSANVAPISCSPYSFDFGNSAADSSCTQRTLAIPYDFIEVRLTEPITVPIFGTSFTLSVHAVARRGRPGARNDGKDFAVAVLDPHQVKALDFTLTTSCILSLCTPLNLTNSTGQAVMVGSVISDSDAPSSISVDGDGTGSQVTCGGPGSRMPMRHRRRG